MSEHTSSQAIMQLAAQARAASQHAYSPYSGAQVGAAVTASDGRVFTGCNVENASYGLTQCAERNALATAIAAGIAPRSMRSLAIYATGFSVLTPCGACRQVMSELLAEDAMIHSCSEEGEIRSWGISELFPEPFTLE